VCLILLFRGHLNHRGIRVFFGRRQPLQGAPRRILFGNLLGASHAPRQGSSGLAFGALQPDLDLKPLAVVGTAFALDPIDRRSQPFCLQVLLQRRLVVAQRFPGLQVPGQLLGSFAHHPAAGKCPNRLHSSVKENRCQHCFHRIGKHSAFATEAAFILTPAEAQVTAQTDRRTHLCHVLAADQLRPDASQFPLVPFRVKQKKRFRHDQPQNRVS
jgi:hypothetical protein